MKTNMAIKVVLRGIINVIMKKPLCVSFEITHSCPANCRHCDKGGIKKETNIMGLEDYQRFSKELSPTVCQLSGGEPLLHRNLEGIARAIKRSSGLPLLICVTNGWLLTEDRYLSLMDAGVDFFSVSLDFPDERHDEFRRLNGLYKKLSDIVPFLAKKYKLGNIALNTALTSANFKEIPQLVELAEEWGVKISFSSYCVLRTGDLGYSIQGKDELEILNKHINYLIEHRKGSKTVLNTEYVLKNTLRFFRKGGIPGCLAGQRFLVVRPDGLINPCSMFPNNRYRSQEEAMEDFTAINECDKCYVSIRSLSERPLGRLLLDSLDAFRRTR